MALAIVAALVAIPQQGWGQQVTAAITGVVTDPSGAPIANAAVTAKDTQRGTAWTTQTNDAGAYNLPRVPIGIYDISVQAKGFQTAVRPAIQLEINQTARVDVQMTIGEVSQTIEVSSAAPLLQTETTQLSTVINSKTNEDLPLASRNYVQLTLLAPGTIHPDPSSDVNTIGYRRLKPHASAQAPSQRISRDASVLPAVSEPLYLIRSRYKNF
ncbi:MAG: hypothetical protein DMG57_06920 [Acidobacteria bacterium]|nr:MAG: hypothetical protein DMG57_06920 [Acidobacteriota bacterium]